MAKEVWFRGDGGATIGFGHLARLAALAAEAAARGRSCRFVLNDDARAAAFIAARAAGEIITAPRTLDEEIAFLIENVPPAPLVADLRGKDPAFYERLRDAAVFVAAVDDMGEEIAAPLVINGSADPSFARYLEIRPPQRFLCGPAFIPLPPFFAAAPPPADDPCRTRLLVAFGGADADDFTRQTLTALEDMPPLALDVALGPAYSFGDEVRSWVRTNNHDVAVHAPAPDMLPLYDRARLAVAAGGVTQYELLGRGVPAVSIPHVAREKAEADAFAAAGAIKTFPVEELKKGGAVARAVATLWRDDQERRRMAKVGRGLIDGRGAARVWNVVEGMAA